MSDGGSVASHNPRNLDTASPNTSVCLKCQRELTSPEVRRAPSDGSIRSTALLTAPLVNDERTFKHRLGEFLESARFHRVLLVLISIDAIFVLMELFYIVLKPTCPPSEKDELPRWLENLAHATLAIDCLFVVEIPLDLYAFGPRYYGLSLRKPAVQHAYLHLFDAVIILGTVILETALKGKEKELAGLLVVLRLWRVVKVVGGVAVSVGEWDEAKAETLEDAKKTIRQLQKENEGLKRRLATLGEV